MRSRRLALGFTQAELARRTQIARTNIVAIESGKRSAGTALRDKITEALKALPGDLLARNRNAVCEAVHRSGFQNPRVFGSCAKYQDRYESDVDLIVDKGETQSQVDLIDKARLLGELEGILSVPTDLVIDSGRESRMLSAIRLEAIAL